MLLHNKRKGGLRSVFVLLVLVFIGAVALYWAQYVGGRSAWLCVYGICGLLLYLGLVMLGHQRELEVDQSTEPRLVWSGNPVKIALELRFRQAWLPCAWLLVEETWTHTSSGERLQFRELCRPSVARRLLLSVQLSGLRRGCYRLDAVTVSVSDAFGLLLLSRSVPVQQHLLWVLPRPLQLPHAARVSASAGDAPPRLRRATQQQLALQATSPLVSGTRPYAPGDPFHRIHWRTSARAGALRAKESEQPPGLRRLLVCVDATRGRSNAAAFESALEAAAGLAQRALQLGLSVRLAACDRQGRTFEAPSLARLGGLLQLLALLPCDGNRPLGDWVQREALHQDPGTGVAVVTAQPDAQLARILFRLRKRAVHLVYIHGEGARPDAVEHWRQQAEAAGCRYTAVRAGSRSFAEGGEGDGAAAKQASAGE